MFAEASRRRRGSSRSARATSPRRCARSRARSAGTRSSSTRAPGSQRASACRARTSRRRVARRDRGRRRHRGRLARARGAARHSRPCARASRAARSTSARSARSARRRSAASSSGTLADSIHGPVGLDLGGEGPAEIALEILAEILQAKDGCAEPRARARLTQPCAGRATGDKPSAPEQQVQPVVGRVHGQPVEAADDADQPEREVGDPAAGQVACGLPRAPGQQDRRAERDVNELCSTLTWKMPSSFASSRAREAEVAVVRRDTRE